MIRKIIMAAIMMSCGVFGLVNYGGEAWADGDGTDFYSDICESNVADELKQQAGCAPDRKLSNVAVTLVNAAIAVIGLAAVIVIIYGGIKYSSSFGDASKVAAAKNTIIYGVIGLVVAMLAWAIVAFITASFGTYDVGGEAVISTKLIR